MMIPTAVLPSASIGCRTVVNEGTDSLAGRHIVKTDLDPKLRLGAPIFTGVNKDIETWPMCRAVRSPPSLPLKSNTASTTTGMCVTLDSVW